MKYIKLDCATLGKKPGDIVEVGEGEGQIPLEDAKTLIAERMAEAFVGPVVGGNNERIKELEEEITDLNEYVESLKGQLDELTARNTELNEYVESLKGQLDELTARNTELEGQLALLDPKPATGKK